VKVFVYGTLMRECSNHDLLRTSRFLGEDIIEVKLRMIDLGAFPALVPSQTLNRIHGEVYAVTRQVMDELDRLEGYPDLYRRKPVQTRFGPAQVYYMTDKPADAEDIASGSWREPE